jgi:hypothetical protein
MWGLVRSSGFKRTSCSVFDGVYGDVFDWKDDVLFYLILVGLGADYFEVERALRIF